MAGKIALALLMFSVLATVLTLPVLFVWTAFKVGLDYGELAAGTMEFDWMGDAVIRNILLALQSLSMIAAAWIMWIAFERKAAWSLGFKRGSWLKEGAAGSVWGIVFMTISFLAIWSLGGLRVVGSGGEGLWNDLLLAIVIFALVAISEEMLSRGYIQGLIRHHYGRTIAIAAASLIFAGMHLMNTNVLQNPYPMLNLFLAGVLMGVAREVTNSLWVPIGIHFTWNLFQGNVYGFHVSGNDFFTSFLQIEATGRTFISGGEFGAEGSVATAVILVCCTYGLYRFYKKREIG